MIKSSGALITALFFFVSINAETHLSGDIRSATFDSTGNPYIVDQNVVVPGGKRLTIEEGCVFLFKGFTGLNVLGRIHVAGSARRPVVFTSVNDRDNNPKSDSLPSPFDWNGILIAKESDSALFENFQLRYSLYGIKSQNTSVAIRNAIFGQNGQFNFTINGKPQYIQDNILYSYNPSDAGGKPEKTSVAPPVERPITGKTDTTKTILRPILRYSSLGVGAVGIVVGAIFLSKRSQTLSDRDAPDFIKKYPNDPGAKWNDLNNTAKGQGRVSGLCFGLGALGLIGFGLMFVF